MSKHPKTDLYQEERLKGKSYRQIAEQYGVSFQAVAQACGKYTECQFRPWTEERCIYPNLRKWLNDNRVSLFEFIRRMDLVTCNRSSSRFGGYFNGTNYPQKQVIDKMLEVTGLTYEQMWEVDNEQ